MKITKAFVVLTAALYLSGCANKNTLPSNALDQFKKIGVVSHTAETLHKLNIGMSVFGNNYDHQDISEWKIDETYEIQLASEIEAILKVESVIIGDHLDFSQVNSLDGPYSAPAFWGPNFDAIKNVTLTACQENKLDALFIVARYQGSDFIGITNQKIEGAGIYTRRKTTLVHLLSKIGVMDCKLGKVIAVTRLINDSTAKQSVLNQNPAVIINRNLAQKAYSEWNKKEKNKH